MIRKIKNILKPHHDSSVNSTHLPYDVASTDSISSCKSHTDKSKHGSPKINFIKRKLKSTKSWVRPKHGKFEDSIYDCVLPEPADHEFESYTKNNYIFSNNSDNYMDYGFKMPYKLNSQSSLTQVNENDSNSYRNSSNTYTEGQQSQESYRYFKIIQKLSKSSFTSPANVPILCTQSFNTTDSNWNSFSNRLNATKNDLKLIILNKGEPVNAMFYLSDLDLIYVKTADDLEGFVPRSYCKLFSQNDNHENDYLKPEFGTLHESNYNQNSSYNNSSNINKMSIYGSEHNESIKYHSLSSSEYDDLNEEHVYSNIPAISDVNKVSSPAKIINPQLFLKPITNYFTTIESNERRISDLYQVKRKDANPVKQNYDTGYREETENLTHFSSMHSNSLLNEYEETGNCIIDKLEVSPHKINHHLLMQSRSRLPISIRSNLNLEIMDEHDMLKKTPLGFENFTYKTSPNVACSGNRTRLSIALTPKTNKNTRRSLDPSLSSVSQKYSILRDFENKHRHNMTDLDVNKIELDSINESSEKNLTDSIINNVKSSKIVKKHWHIILKHEAKTHQEMSVEPGMIVLVIRQHKDWLYIKLIEDGNLNKIQKYGFIPRSCAVDLEEVIYKGQEDVNKAQITAL